MTHTITDEEYDEYQRLKAREPNLQLALDKMAATNVDLDRFRAQSQVDTRSDYDIFSELQAIALANGPRHATPPFANPAEGDVYIDANDALQVFIGGRWINPNQGPRLTPRQDEQRSPFQEELNKHVSERLAYIANHREALLEAWIAQYGFSPAETMLVTETKPDGIECTYVRRTGDAAELEAFRKREEHVRDLLSLTSEAVSKLESLRGHVREGLVSGLREALVAVRDFKVTP